MMFSVIIPCYNSEKTLHIALSSVASQTFKDFEIVIVDDGSTDATKQVVETFFQNTTLSYRYIYQENAGAGSARNLAVKHSSGDFLAFLDADDEWRADKLEMQYALICEKKARFISSSYTFDSFTQDGEVVLQKYNFRDFLFFNRTSTPCTVVERRLFDEVGGFLDSQRYSEDYHLWLKISQKEPLYFLQKPSLARLHKRAYGQSGLSAHMWQMEKGELFNYAFCYKKGFISLGWYLFFVGYSLAKYTLRVLKNFIHYRKNAQ
ncbi:MAG: glycosyltransferase family A protein [Sulfurospirillaceae bacterium]|nr:glycosyltransferase family A protein [Sulfurospirillaceae bacterium]